MKYLMLITLVSTSCWSETFKIGGELVNFQNKDGLLVHGCAKNCEALTIVSKHKKIDLKELRKTEKLKGSIGSDVCRLSYSANSLLGINEVKDQRAFCVFKDNSLIEINSLSQYLSTKKIVTE